MNIRKIEMIGALGLRKLAIMAAAPATLLFFQSGPAAAGCEAFDKKLLSAERVADTEKAAKLYRSAESSGNCGGEALRHLGRNTALAFYRSAYRDDIGESERFLLLREGLKFGRPWQLLASVADIEHAAGKFEISAGLYQEALDDLRDKKSNPTAPPSNVIASIYKKAETARLLSPVYVKRVDRAGEPSGLACPVYRGFSAKKTAIPIEFEYNKTDFTEKGQTAANDMFDYLVRQGAPAVVLVGHTDPRGTTQYNQRLSTQRAQAVASFLKSKGYNGNITASGRGEAERFQPDDPGRYSDEQRYQLDRRVELSRKLSGKTCISSK